MILGCRLTQPIWSSVSAVSITFEILQLLWVVDTLLRSASIPKHYLIFPFRVFAKIFARSKRKNWIDYSKLLITYK